MPVFAAALFLAGAMDAVTDVALYAHGLRVQRRYGRSVINSFHTICSVGAVTGGAMAAAAIALDLTPGQHLTVSAVVFGPAPCTPRRRSPPPATSPWWAPSSSTASSATGSSTASGSAPWPGPAA